ncbi:SDA1-domain-containing protein [Entophlyctis helioformis]|nr:SDA1-domain-containing protein [Entophlyctis helioformis]
MASNKRTRAEVLISNLPQLQNKIKRDPSSYREEFMQQWRHFESSLAIFNLKPQDSAISNDFADQITFLAHVSQCYPKDTKEYPDRLIETLTTHFQIMSPEVRKTMVQALILMRNRGLINPTKLLGLFFTLFRCKDKALREMLHNHIVADIKNSNAKSKNNALNKTLQNFMYTMLKDTNEVAAKKSLEVMIELYKKNIWNDAKTVNVIAEACFSPTPKIVASAVHFFLGADEKEEVSDSDEDGPDIASLRHANTINKKKKSRRNTLQKAQASVKRKERAKSRAEHFNFSALHLLNDPQGFAEKLFSRLRHAASKNMYRFELRLQMINLVSRLIGVHKLLLLGFYEFVVPYLKPHQRDVTLILSYVAQSSHELVPPDALEAVVRAIADNFVWSNYAAEVVTAGLNSLREICARCPLAMPEELLQSLIDDFKKHREKGPMNAARSLLGLYRDVNPEMLRKKDRGKAASVNIKSFKAKRYGELDVMSSIQGADALDDSEEGEEGSDDDSEAPELVSDDEEGEGESDDEEVAFEDIDDDGEVIELDSDEFEDDDEDDDGEGEDDDEDEDEDEEDEEDEVEPSPAKKRKTNVLAERILTDEDFARMRERHLEQEAERLAGVKGRSIPVDDGSDSDNGPHDFVDVSRIMSGTRKKNDYEARMEKIKAGREGREFGSRKGKEERTSLTNKVKAKKNKAFMMIVHKRSVVGKKKMSLRDKQRVLRAHIKKQKLNYK